jgi:ubiquitin-conjugating enzyme E2 Q
MMRPQGPRARYLADHELAVQGSIPNIKDISNVEGEGEFSFTYTHPHLASSSGLRLDVIPQDYSSYPSEHLFLVMVARNYAISSTFSDVIENFLATSNGMKVGDALRALSQSLTDVLEGQSKGSITDDGEDTAMTDVDDTQEDLYEDEDEDNYDDFELVEDQDDDLFGLGSRDNQNHIPANVEPETLSRICKDLQALRSAGFKVGTICGFKEAASARILSASVRVDKLCLSEETRDAWNLKADDFIVLLIRYGDSYLCFDKGLAVASHAAKLTFCLRKCRVYKPAVSEALKAFAQPDSSSTKAGVTGAGNAEAGDTSALDMLHVANSIDTFMNSDFMSMLKLRLAHGTNWDGASKELRALRRSFGVSPSEDIEFQKNAIEKFKLAEDASDKIKLPAFIANEHLISSQEKSLPLVAAQFAMRYLLRCTEYCMICHQQVDGNLEALKPFVCNDSLCLFQYMAMGFGPRIEMEVMNQPSVVDLLINFFYAGIHHKLFYDSLGGGIREFPTGINLQVPGIFPVTDATGSGSIGRMPASSQTMDVAMQPPYDHQEAISVTFDPETQSALLVNRTDIERLKLGIWVVVVLETVRKDTVFYHCRVEDMVGSRLLLRIAGQHLMPPDPIKERVVTHNIKGMVTASMVLYNQNLDDLTPNQKAFAMLTLLAATPSVKAMREHLMSNGSYRLDKWERLTPSAAKLLQWIVASNRSYIVQVGQHPDFDTNGAARHDEKLGGVDGWLQFRFAQGSPEKEVEFLQELKTVNKPQKTILAWHGSRLANWHSIIREGLDFKQTLNGRAYGHGVYFGKDLNTSLGYTHGSSVWPNSSCPITAAVSLNEIVNKPAEFVHQSSIYVVQHTHWIQCRYLLVKPLDGLETLGKEDKRKDVEFIQDPTHGVLNAKKKIFVPKRAIPSAQEGSATSLVPLRFEAAGHSGDSDDEDADDVKFLCHGEDEAAVAREDTPTPLENDSTAVGRLDTKKTDFRPGLLDLSTLPRLAPPSYATQRAVATIQREVQKLQKIQATTPVHELGWYVNFNALTNLFQWIAELHSFDEALPLAQDMRARGIPSIVLELRFGRNFPHSPPFVRVVRPRFLPFLGGGGGHVTAGGAMCMELLTDSGWSPANSFESVLLQVRMAICSTDPKPARLARPSRNSPDDAYHIREAYDAYTRAATGHGWAIPADIKEAVEGMADSG